MPLVVGIPKEIKPREKRVGLTPAAAGELARLGLSVLVQKGAGTGSGYSDRDYVSKGASLAASAQELYAKAGLVQKVKEPLPSEYPYLRKGLLIFGFLHLASQENCELVRALEKAGVTAVGFETLVEQGRLPVLAPMSEIAGGLGAVYAAFFQSIDLVRGNRINYPSDFQKRIEEIASHYPTVPPLSWGLTPVLKGSDPNRLRVVIFGGGIAGQAASKAVKGLGGEAVIVEKNDERRNQLEWQGFRVFSPEKLPEAVLEQADILIGCAHAVGQRAVHVLDSQTLETISRGAARRAPTHRKIIIDISIDQGGNFPGSRSTSYDDPLYLDAFGNLRFAVPNIPSLAGRAASEALSKASLKYTGLLALKGKEAFHESEALRGAVNLLDGEIILEALKKAHQK